jgi:hypothetical protein
MKLLLCVFSKRSSTDIEWSVALLIVILTNICGSPCSDYQCSRVRTAHPSAERNGVKQQRCSLARLGKPRLLLVSMVFGRMVRSSCLAVCICLAQRWILCSSIAVQAHIGIVFCTASLCCGSGGDLDCYSLSCKLVVAHIPAAQYPCRHVVIACYVATKEPVLVSVLNTAAYISLQKLHQHVYWQAATAHACSLFRICIVCDQTHASCLSTMPVIGTMCW